MSEYNHGIYLLKVNYIFRELKTFNIKKINAMIRIYSIIAIILLSITLRAQSPEKMSYQAVIRDGSNQLVTNQLVRMQISILQGSADGTIIFIETQTQTTNSNGLISIEIGSGAVVNGSFSNIDWVSGPYFIKTETDLEGGINYTVTGTSQLLSVPYALHATTAQTVLSGVEVINSNKHIYNGNAVTQWADLDLSSTIGKTSAILFLKVTNNDLANAARFIFKQKGDNSIYQSLNDPGFIFTSLNEGCFGQVMVRSDENGIIEWYSNNSFECTIELLTYIK